MQTLNLATYCDPHGTPELVSTPRNQNFIRHTDWGVDACVRRFQSKVPEAVAALNMSGNFVASVHGDIELKDHWRLYRPHRSWLSLDIPKPEGYDPDSYYMRVYEFEIERGQLKAHSRIMDDYIACEPTQSFSEAQELERLTGVITLAEYYALKVVMRGARDYLGNRAIKTKQIHDGRKRLVLPPMNVA
jgi:hypothetical protein